MRLRLWTAYRLMELWSWLGQFAATRHMAASERVLRLRLRLRTRT